MCSFYRNSLLRGAALFMGSLFLLLAFSCNNQHHFIKDKKLRERVKQDFASRDSLLGGEITKQRFSFGDKEITDEVRGALEFLYAYMPLSDVIDYSQHDLAKDVYSSLQAREEMPWGDLVPEKVFLHFVLPPRVNNETLDASRPLFYKELKERVKGLSMRQAALEVNHWCHEWVTYAPSDARTRSPLATKRNALGRCGEESTFTVAALRAVGIPARQVYTPRWAHTDDNHAWVEVWIEGKWYFLGACEPAADLNIAWFNSSVVRAMLVHTKVFGYYEGPEEVLQRTPNFTEINCIDNYITTRKAEVRVVDKEGKPVPNATVRYCIYNYSEFYPVAKLESDDQGTSVLSVGYGDMIVWASKGDLMGYALSKSDQKEPLTITLTTFDELPASAEFSIIPPKGEALPTTATEEAIALNDKRLTEEDSIRKAYELTFAPTKEEVKLSQAWGLPEGELTQLYTTARSNTHHLIDFIEKASNKSLALAFLQALSAKDQSDIERSLLDAFFAKVPDEATSFELEYLYNPRIHYEHLSNWQKELEILKDISDNPQEIFDFINQKVIVDDVLNRNGKPISPAGVIKWGRADLHSIKIAYVAALRYKGIPARINESTRAVEYSLNKGAEWHKVDFESQSITLPKKGRLDLVRTPDTSTEPKYYSHFTIARMDDRNSFPATIYYDYTLSNELRTLFATPQELEEGNYIIVSGTRMASGTVLAHVEKFKVSEGTTTKQSVKVPVDPDDVSVIGSINAEATYLSVPNLEPVSIISTTGRGYFVLAILKRGTEPTNHALKDLERVQTQLNAWGRPFLLLFTNEHDYKGYKKEEFPTLPSNLTYGVDLNGAIEKMVREAVNSTSSDLPLVIVADSFGRVVFVRQGYTISLGDQILSILPKL